MKVGDLVKYEWEMQVDNDYHTFVSVGVVLETWMRLYIESAWIQWCCGAEAQWVDCDKLEVMNESR
tara:strand:+ start:2016 stop:2213 length:198 start_codon:yes stop_codon:yes gene_type:complete